MLQYLETCKIHENEVTHQQEGRQYIQMKTGQINGQQVDRTLQEAEKLDKPTPGGDTRGRTAGTLKGAQTGHRVKEAPTLRDSELLGAGMYSKIPLSCSLNKDGKETSSI